LLMHTFIVPNVEVVILKLWEVVEFG